MMSLRVLMAKRNLDAEREKLSQKRQDLEALKLREAELREAIEEAETEEEREVVERSVTEFEQERDALAEDVSALEQTISQLEETLSTLEAQQNKPVEEPAPEDNREGLRRMEVRDRHSYLEREDVKAFLQGVRDIKHNRGITGAELTIPNVVLTMIQEQVERESKLRKHINVVSVGGASRQTILGAAPEASWGKMSAAVTEKAFSIYAATLDGFKVSAAVPIDNYILEDSDEALATVIINQLGKSLAKAYDHAIIGYGSAGEHPMGIRDRLESAADLTGYTQKTDRPFVDLSTSNVITITGKSDAALFKALVEAAGNCKADYSNGAMFWAMTTKTKTKLVAAALSINAAGAVTAGLGDTMPVIGGAIETLDSILEDDVIIGGYGDGYLMAERMGAKFTTSDQYKFLDDQTVYMATQRLDGMPIIPEAFVEIKLA